jgi:hypothetical protein
MPKSEPPALPLSRFTIRRGLNWNVAANKKPFTPAGANGSVGIMTTRPPIIIPPALECPEAAA